MPADRRPPVFGGMFGLAEPLVETMAPPPFISGDSVCLLNGRSCIAVLVDRLSPPTVWVPSYVCRAVVDALEGRARVKFYEVDARLTIGNLDWMAHVQRGDLVIVIDYFGIQFEASCASLAATQGAWVLRDACQALLNRPVPGVDAFVIVSPRKFLGVPDGGVLTVSGSLDHWQPPRGEPPPSGWWLSAVRAALWRRDFEGARHSGDWFALFQSVEATAPVGPYAMSDLARSLLYHAFDFTTIGARRIANYQVLAELLSEFALFPTLPPGAVPLGYPMRVAGRDRIQQALFEENIFPMVHWPLDGVVPEQFRASHRLAREIMTLPCDQRYDEDDMRRLASVVAAEIRR